jgi:hypothetical protein
VNSTSITVRRLEDSNREWCWFCGKDTGLRFEVEHGDESNLARHYSESAYEGVKGGDICTNIICAKCIRLLAQALAERVAMEQKAKDARH